MNTPRSFDYFRINQAPKRVGISVSTLRAWAKRPGGPVIIRMNTDKITWMRYSEVEDYIEKNSIRVETPIAA